MTDQRSRGDTVVVSGAFSYTGKYTTRRLLRRGYKIRTLTYDSNRANPFGGAVEVFPYTCNAVGRQYASEVARHYAQSAPLSRVRRLSLRNLLHRRVVLLDAAFNQFRLDLRFLSFEQI